jgi:hypothetical protein
LNVRNWANENSFINENIKLENELSLSNNIFFRYQLPIVIFIVVLRLALAHIIIHDTIILGNIIIDTISIFLITSFVITSIGSILYLYKLASKGIKIEYSFDIRTRYKKLEDILTFNTIIISVYLIIFGILVIIWSHQTKQYTIGIIVDILIIITIFFVFILGLVGIRYGISNTKAYMEGKAKNNLDRFASKAAPLLESREASFHEMAQAIATLTYFEN